MDNFSQDDIDKLLQDALVGDEEESPDIPAPHITDEALGASASQDDIDALFDAVGSDELAQDDLGQTKAMEPISSPNPPEASPAPPEPAAPPSATTLHEESDLAALFSAMDEEGEPGPPSGGDSGQDAIDELFSAMEGGALTPPPPDLLTDEPEGEGLETRLAQAEAEADSEAAKAESDFHELLSSIAGEDPAPAAPAPDGEAGMEAPAESPMEALGGVPDAPPPESGGAEPAELDMNALLREVAAAVPPAPDNAFLDAGDTTVLSPDLSTALAEAEAGHGGLDPAGPVPLPHDSDAPGPGGAVAAEPSPAAPPPPAPVPPPPAAGPRREYSVLAGAGEVESAASQIGMLLAAMTEKSQNYLQAWIAADSEARELRTRALDEERRRVSLEGEKQALGRQVEELRTRLAAMEGARVEAEESMRTLESTLQARNREMENRLGLLQSETEALKGELDRARNQTSGVELESRRARFEVDRLKNEVEAERMERMRIQRALDNREKELQALQAQSSGQASSLFIDELHRLVRRLESELDARASGAHEALRQLDRLELPESMVPVASNLRAALMQALGQDGDVDDALKSLGREASGIKGPASVAPAKAEMVSFETAISTYNLVGAVEVAGALLREGSASPGTLMRKIYQCQALRRPECADHLGDLARLLEGLRTVQESSDRTRGSETAESEIFYVHMFDFLHNLVRLKLISRVSGDIWRIFLDLRGRFSFVTSDRQWAEYRDKTLKS